LQLVNVENLSAFKACITRSGDPELQRQYAQYKARRAVYDESKALGLKAIPPPKNKAFNGFIEGIPDGLNGEDLLNLLLQRHEPVAHYFGTDRIGLRLQKMDSEVMTSAIDKLKGIPCLPVHDSIRCKVSDVGVVKSAMKSAFKEVTGQSIPVD
jgi:hypothetical protein